MPPPVPMPSIVPPADPQRPRRVVGLSLDSTMQGGGGPAFAVGNTLGGVTAERAVNPADIAPHDPLPAGDKPVPAAALPGPNRAAARLPTAGGKIVLPRRKRPSALDYPETLKSQGIESQVTVQVEIDVRGQVTGMRIVKGSGYPLLDESAKKAALLEEFEPATRDGQSIPYTLSFTYRFRLEES